MQISPDTMRLLMEMEAPADQKVALMKAMEADWLAYQAPTALNGVNEERERLRNESTYAERKRAKDRERRASEREELRRLRDASTATTPATTGEAQSASGDQPATAAAPSRTHVVVSSLPSLRSEEITPKLPSVAIPPKAKSTSKPSRRCPEAWSPSARCRQLLAGEGYEAGDLERALTRMRDHEFKTARTDWDATFRNWVREDRERRKSQHPSASNSRADRRGVWAEIAAEAGGPGPRRLTGSG